jgi:hypothetical protein
MAVALALLFLVEILSVSHLALARGPILDESRGVLTEAPMPEAATPAVVNIAVLTRAVGDDNPLLRDPSFRRYFGLPDQGVPQRQSRLAGSGVIIDAAKGYIVTNHHGQRRRAHGGHIEGRSRSKPALLGAMPARTSRWSRSNRMVFPRSVSGIPMPSKLEMWFWP